MRRAIMYERYYDFSSQQEIGSGRVHTSMKMVSKMLYAYRDDHRQERLTRHFLNALRFSALGRSTVLAFSRCSSSIVEPCRIFTDEVAQQCLRSSHVKLRSRFTLLLSFLYISSTRLIATLAVRQPLDRAES